MAESNHESESEAYTDNEDKTDDQQGTSENANNEEEDHELKQRQARENDMSETEREELKDRAQEIKTEGNNKFKAGSYEEAVTEYTEALAICPLCCNKERSVMFSNRAACYFHLDQYEDVIKDCTEALALHPAYIKALKRRAESYDKTDKLDEALDDYKKLLELEPGCQEARIACQRLPQQINERNERLKTEMFGKLKDLGNLVLNPFGLSTDNFKFEQNESGGYSVNFQNSK